MPIFRRRAMGQFGCMHALGDGRCARLLMCARPVGDGNAAWAASVPAQEIGSSRDRAVARPTVAKSVGPAAHIFLVLKVADPAAFRVCCLNFTTMNRPTGKSRQFSVSRSRAPAARV